MPHHRSRLAVAALAMMLVALLGAGTVQAQAVPLVVEGAQVRLVKHGSSGRRSPVHGTVTQLSADSVVVRVDRVRTGWMSPFTTGVYRDTLVAWTPEDSGIDLEVIAGYRSRPVQGLTWMLVGGVVGAASGLLLNSMCPICTDAEIDEGRSTSALFFGAFGATAGLAFGLARSRTIWKRVSRTGFSVVPIVSTIGPRSTFVLAVRYSPRAR